jgi:hypothetical protein
VRSDWISFHPVSAKCSLAMSSQAECHGDKRDGIYFKPQDSSFRFRSRSAQLSTEESTTANSGLSTSGGPEQAAGISGCDCVRRLWSRRLDSAAKAQTCLEGKSHQNKCAPRLTPRRLPAFPIQFEFHFWKHLLDVLMHGITQTSGLGPAKLTDGRHSYPDSW